MPKLNSKWVDLEAYHQWPLAGDGYEIFQQVKAELQKVVDGIADLDKIQTVEKRVRKELEDPEPTYILVGSYPYNDKQTLYVIARVTIREPYEVISSGIKIENHLSHYFDEDTGSGRIVF